MRFGMFSISRGAGVAAGAVLVTAAITGPAHAAPGAVLAVRTAAQAAGAPAVSALRAAAGPSGVAAKSAVLWDATVGKTLWTRLPDTKRPIGSITKTMTAYVVIKAGKLDRTITVKQSYINYAIRHGGSMAHLKAGDKLTAGQLLHGLMLPSGCDAAFALADVYGPGWKGFVKKMNNTAKSLKMSKTYYANFDGLPWPKPTSGYSSARDQVKLGIAGMKIATFRGLVGKQSYSIAANARHKAYAWNNTNKLLGNYPGAAGIKTGHTDASGYSLLFTAKRGSRTLIGSVLNSSTTVPNARFTDATKVLNWGFGTETATTQSFPSTVGDKSIP